MTKDVAGNDVIAGVRGDLKVDILSTPWPALTSGWATLAGALNRLSQIGLLLLVLAPPVWVFLDAGRRRLPASLWALFVLPTSLVGMLVYALANREVGLSCPECGERINPRFAVCPYCRSELKGVCPNCGQTIGLDWHYCPSCSAEV